MTVWIIEPRDPLIVRDGRPFSANPGARARTLPFPFPSTIAGGVRTRAGQDDNGRFTATVDQVLKITVRGPLLVKIGADNTSTFLAPAPADALLFTVDDAENKADRKLLTPLHLPKGIKTNLPSKKMFPVGLPIPDPRKPIRKPPRFWHWSQFEKWLIAPKQTGAPEETRIDLADLGVAGPLTNRRTHVGIEPDSQTGKDGALFMTSGLTFLHEERLNGKRSAETAMSHTNRLGFATKVENLPNPLSLTAGYAPLGGERRMMHWCESSEPLPDPPNGLFDAIIASGHCRLILLTPAYFKKGWRPKWMLNKRHKVKVKLKAAAVGQPQTVSGWNFEKGRRGPKPTRRLAAAGSVYYLQLTAKKADDIRVWLDNVWLHAVSDGKENRQSGFGLAAIGTWSGVPTELMNEEVQNA